MQIVHEMAYRISRDRFGNYELRHLGTPERSVHLQGDDAALFESEMDGYLDAHGGLDSLCRNYTEVMVRA